MVEMEKTMRMAVRLALLTGLLSLPANAQLGTPVPVVDISIAGTAGPAIDRHIYGQFAEHLGRGIYEGIWVGENSKIPNINGYRKDVVQALKAIHVPVVRWPGGCFADTYHWRDGIGPQDKRPSNVHGGHVEEINAVDEPGRPSVALTRLATIGMVIETCRPSLGVDLGNRIAS